MNKKVFVNMVFVALVVVLIGVVGYLTLLKKAISPATTPQINTSTIQDTTAKWKTYRNEKFGFEFQYPPELVRIRDLNKEGIYKDREEFSAPPISEDEICLQSPDPSRTYMEHPCTISIWGVLLNGKTIEEWLRADDIYSEGSKEEWIKSIGGIYEWRMIGSNNWLYIYDLEGPGDSEEYHIVNPTRSAVIIADPIVGDVDTKKILSTFKFLQ